MKKLNIYLLFQLLTLCAMAQVHDKVNSDGTRIIACSPHVMTHSALKMPAEQFSLCHQKGYIIRVAMKGPINGIREKSIILIKLQSGETIESEQILSDIQQIDMCVLPYGCIGWYRLSDDQVRSIVAEGISKIRVETKLQNIDLEYPEKKQKGLNEALKKQYADIEYALTKSKDIRDGF